MKEVISLLSGPVMISPKVSRAFAKPAISHRSLEFAQLMQSVQHKLHRLTKAKYSTLMMGSGTLANEAIAANLSQLKNETGLIISNGEFGERLMDQAVRFELKFKRMEEAWGSVFNYKKLEHIFLKNKIDWIWFVHSETSTGVMNDFEKIAEIAKKYRAKVCVDCMSSIGIYPINLAQVYLASASTNKGLEAYMGIGIVLFNHQPKPSKKMPKYLDIGFYHQHQSTPFTFSSNLLAALNTSLDIVLAPRKLNKIKKLSANLIDFCDKQKITIIADKKSRSLAIVTLAFSQPNSSERLGDFLSSQGVLILYKNQYLASRNWVQVGFFSNSIKLVDLKKFQNLVAEFFDGQNRESEAMIHFGQGQLTAPELF